jgi:hypothetical protein
MKYLKKRTKPNHAFMKFKRRTLRTEGPVSSTCGDKPISIFVSSDAVTSSELMLQRSLPLPSTRPRGSPLLAKQSPSFCCTDFLELHRLGTACPGTGEVCGPCFFKDIGRLLQGKWEMNTNLLEKTPLQHTVREKYVIQIYACRVTIVHGN